MSPTSTDSTDPKGGTSRVKLTAARVIEGAVVLADEIGIDAFTIRRLADIIDAKPMTIYYHLPNKEAIIDGMVDFVFGEIELPPADCDWRTALLVRSRSMRDVLARHPWASPLMESRTSPGLSTLQHHDAVLGCFRAAGFSWELTGHAYAAIDAFLYGFALQEATLPATSGEEMAELATAMAEQMPADTFPHLAQFTTEHVLKPGYNFGDEFEYGLGLILDGLERAATSEGES